MYISQVLFANREFRNLQVMQQQRKVSITKTKYPGDDKFYKIELPSKHDTYENVGFHFKKNDNNFIIYELNGRTLMGFNKCLEKKNTAIKEIKEILTKVSVNNYKSDYRKKYGKSFSEVTDLKVEKGYIRIYLMNKINGSGSRVRASGS